MTRWNIESVEVVETRFDLRPVFHRITHRDKNVFDFLPDECYRMKVTLFRTYAGQGDIKRLAFERSSLRLSRKLFCKTCDLSLDLGADFIHLLPKFGALTSRDRSDSLFLSGNKPGFPTDISVAQGGQVVGGCNRLQILQESLP